MNLSQLNENSPDYKDDARALELFYMYVYNTLGEKEKKELKAWLVARPIRINWFVQLHLDGKVETLLEWDGFIEEDPEVGFSSILQKIGEIEAANN